MLYHFTPIGWINNNTTNTSSFLPHCNNNLETNIIDSELHCPRIDWLSIKNEQLNEYTTPFLATMAFPTLFLDGKGDPTNPSTQRDISFSSGVQHLIKFSENIDGKWIYHFASHPRFSYWALNMIQGKRTLQQTTIFMKQNPSEAHLTIEDLRNMVMNDSSSFMSKLSRYVANITGSNAYWYTIKDLKAIIAYKEAPTIFFTFSSAEMQWPELHSLFNENSGDLNHEQRRKNIDNPHLVDWFFVASLMACNFHIAQFVLSCLILSCPVLSGVQSRLHNRQVSGESRKEAEAHASLIVTAVVQYTNHNKRDINKFVISNLCNILKISRIHDLVRFDSVNGNYR